MRKKKYRPYLLFISLSLLLFYLPIGLVQGLRNSCVTFSKGGWGKGALLCASFIPNIEVRKKEGSNNLETELLLLRRQNETLRKRLFSEERMDFHIKKLQKLIDVDSKKLEEFYKRRKKAEETLLNLELFSLPAKVIYREPNHWNSTLWIDVGIENNEACGAFVVAVNSPVLRRDHLIGVIEYVGKRKSRVRLVTDASLNLSVRVARGKQGDQELLYRLEQLMGQLVLKDVPQEANVILGELKKDLEKECDDRYLAKGELSGSGSPLWRKRSEVLKGIGFNYDFGDEEGSPLELRSGKPLDQLHQENGVRLIEVGDLLVTTGLDGIFPKDIPVARVSKIKTLKEGSVSYEIEAFLCAGNLGNLFDVVVLPSLNSNEEKF